MAHLSEEIRACANGCQRDDKDALVSLDELREFADRAAKMERAWYAIAAAIRTGRWRDALDLATGGAPPE